MSPDQLTAPAVDVSFRRGDDLCERRVAWSSAAVEDFRAAAPRRTFRWYRELPRAAVVGSPDALDRFEIFTRCAYTSSLDLAEFNRQRLAATVAG